MGDKKKTKINSILKKKVFLAADIAVFCKSEILLIKRKNEPFKNFWALPGGFVEHNERVLHAAKRELQEETGIKTNKLKHAGIFDNPNRDPRGRVISVAHTVNLKTKPKIKASSDANEAKWFQIRKLPKLAADHQTIINCIQNKR